MFDYAALTAVSAVVREGSFERAAAVLGLTPSAVSQRVRGFEERLGGVLVIRGQPCRLTELGTMLCRHFDCVRVLESDLAARLAWQDRGATLPATVKLAVNADSITTWFSHAMMAFARQDPAITLDISIDDESCTAERLRSGDVMAAVTASSDPLPWCRTVSLGRMVYVACASPSFMRVHFSQGVTAETVQKAPYLRFDRRDMFQARWAEAVYGVTLGAPACWIRSSTAFLDLCLHGLGWAMHPLPLVEHHLRSGALVELPPAHRPSMPLFWSVPRLYGSALNRLSQNVQRVAAEWLTD
ncbi:LysR family transcriptional regulator ArgP [Bombella apis]|uniref:LysR family transcriptional regulator ArgP n=1 Tax=Bombella apis TaxID=1785988 RepID=UPI0024A9EF71|nr:LysR family transcriptional regulator ArgP [Bombella apis]